MEYISEVIKSKVKRLNEKYIISDGTNYTNKKELIDQFNVYVLVIASMKTGNKKI